MGIHSDWYDQFSLPSFFQVAGVEQLLIHRCKADPQLLQHAPLSAGQHARHWHRVGGMHSVEYAIFKRQIIKEFNLLFKCIKGLLRFYL